MLRRFRCIFLSDNIEQPVDKDKEERFISDRSNAQSGQNQNDDKRVLIRPCGPDEPWRLPDLVRSGHCRPISATTTSNEDKDSSPVNAPLRYGLNAFILELEECSEDSEREITNEIIFHEVSFMIEEAFENLSRKYPLFRNAIVHKVGSVGEQTKVGIYNEFDFMVELPALEDRLLEECIPMTHKSDPDSAFKILNLNFISDFISESPIPCGSNRTPNMFAQIKSIVSKQLFACLLPNWKPGPNFKVATSEDKGKVRTVRLRYSPENQHSHLDVFCDFSFCIPFEWSPKKLFLFLLCGAEKDIAFDNQRYLMLIRNSEFLTRTNVLIEKEKLCESSASENVKRVYKLSKLLLGKFLPPKYDFKLDNFDGVIPSYWIKQIVFYMMDEFPDKASWQDEFLGLRFMQVIRNLQKCLEKNMLCNYFSPLRNHLLDNSKIDEKNMARKYIPLVAELFSRVTKGDKFAVAFLGTLTTLTEDFREMIATKAKQMRLFLLLLRYKGLTRNDAYIIENTKFFSTMTDEGSLLAVITDYARFHFAGRIEFHGTGRNIRITSGDTLTSLDDYINQIRDDPYTFPDDWSELYDGLLQEHLPPEVTELVSWSSYQPLPIGEIIRTTFGDARQPPSLKNEALLTLEFLMS